MKKIALASAIALASITAAHAAPTVYGKAFVGVDYINTDYEDAKKSDESATKLQSHVSRIGFKGSESLTDTTNVVYQLEYGIKVDDSSTQFTSRNTFLGIEHNTLGTVLAGRHDTPYKLSKGGVAQFDDYTETDIAKVMYGENRENNIIAYKSPTLVGMPLTFMGAVKLSENDSEGDKLLADTVYNADGTVKTAAKYTNEADQKDNGYSASLAYDQNGVYLGAGFDSNIGYADSAWRLAGSVDMGKMNMVNGLMLGAMYQNTNVYDKSDDEKSWLISGKYKVGATPWAVKAQYVNTDNYKGGKDDQATEIALGSEYTFNKATKAHMYVAQINKDMAAANKDEDKTIVGAGLEYKF